MQNFAFFPMRCGRGLVAALMATALGAVSVHALVFDYGAVKVNLDSTFSVGGLYRLENPDPDLYGVANGGNQNSVNTDDGNLNYRKGWASRVVKGTHDLDFKWGNYGAFVRATYFYDFENQDDTRARTPL